MARTSTWLLTISLRVSNLFLMELIFNWENIIFFEYVEWFNLRVFIKYAWFEALVLMHMQSKLSSLFWQLSSTHPHLTTDFRKLSAIIVLCLWWHHFLFTSSWYLNYLWSCSVLIFFVELVFFYLFRVYQLISFFLWRKNPEWKAMKGHK